MFIYYNPNPQGKKVGDCTVRAISNALQKSWDETYMGLCMKGMELADMPSSNTVWGEYLKENGYVRKIIPTECPYCYTVQDFCRDHPTGVFLLSLNSHVVCVINGDWYDIWDSGEESPIFYWEYEGTERKEE